MFVLQHFFQLNIKGKQQQNKESSKIFCRELKINEFSTDIAPYSLPK